MDVAVLHGSLDQSFSPYKSNLRNSRKIQYTFISRPSENFPPSYFQATGGLLPPPPPFLSQHPQPPLLPLPAAIPRRNTYPPANKKTIHGGRSKSKSPKKEERNSPKKPQPKKITPLISSSSGNINSNCISRYNSVNFPAAEMDMFSGSAVFTISPPPSSLPLPTFSLRPKLSCKAEAAAGIDAGATDDLRRLLRLR